MYAPVQKNHREHQRMLRKMNRLNPEATPLLKSCIHGVLNTWATLLASWIGTRWRGQVDNICTEAKREHRKQYIQAMDWSIGTCLRRPIWLRMVIHDLRQHHGTTVYLRRLISAHSQPSFPGRLSLSITLQKERLTDA